MKSSVVQISIFEYNRARLSAKLHKNRLQILSCGRRDNPPNLGATCEVDLLDMWVRDQGIDGTGSGGR